MAEEKQQAQPSVAQTAGQAAPSNTISDKTGQLDARFVLWRTFCAEHEIAVDTLPSELTGKAKEKWEEIKDTELHKPAEKE